MRERRFFFSPSGSDAAGRTVPPGVSPGHERKRRGIERGDVPIPFCFPPGPDVRGFPAPFRFSFTSGIDVYFILCFAGL